MLPRRSKTHPSVERARLSLLVFGSLGAWSLWIVVAPPAQWIVLAVGLLPVCLLWIGSRRLRRAEMQADLAAERPHPFAWVPVTLIVVSILGYGITLTFVHSRYFERRTAKYIRAAHHVDQELIAETAKQTKEASSLAQEGERLSRTRLRLEHATSAAERHKALLTGHEIRELARLEATVKRERRAHADLARALRKEHFAPHSLPSLLAGVLVLMSEESVGAKVLGMTSPSRPSLPIPPRESELPPWFGRLTSFFTVATQLLAGLVIVLAFSHWRGGVSEAVWRTAMPVATVGVVFGLAGNLPSLSRSLQALFLAPVLAGLAGAIGGLLVAAMEPKGV